MKNYNTTLVMRATMMLLVTLFCAAGASAFTPRTVTLKAGDGSGSDITISSGNVNNVALDFRSSKGGQFYEENGIVWFRVPGKPDSFTAPSKDMVFIGWSDGESNISSPYDIIHASGDLTLTAQWAAAGDAKLLSLIPSEGTLDPAFDPDRKSYYLYVNYAGTPVSVTVEATPRDAAAIVRYDDDDVCPAITKDGYVLAIQVINGGNQMVTDVILSIQYTISLTTEGRGTAKAYFLYGDQEETKTGINEEIIVLKATPAAGWRFVRWELVSGNGSLSYATEQNDGRYRIGTDNAVIKAVFEFDGTDVTLNDMEDNSTMIAGCNEKLANVTLQGRTLTTDGCWNALCLPFDLPSLTGTPLEGFTLMELDTADGNYPHATGFDDGTLYLNFKPATAIEAGKPYLAKKLDVTQDSSTPTYTATGGTPGAAANFGYGNLVDGKNTYWRTSFGNGSKAYCEFNTPKAVNVTGYKLTSGNMAQTNDPTVWTLQARRTLSDPWTVIDSRDATKNSGDAVASGRTTPKTYTIAADKQGTYQYFRFEVTRNGGGTLMVLSDLALLGGYAPEGVNITNPVFEAVTINAAAPTAVTSQDGKVTMVGSYSPASLEANDKGVLMLDSYNTLRYPSADMSVGACRARFLLDGILAGATTNLPLGDIDGDGSVSIADISALVDIVLGKTYSSNRVRKVDGNALLEYK